MQTSDRCPLHPSDPCAPPQVLWVGSTTCKLAWKEPSGGLAGVEVIDASQVSAWVGTPTVSVREEIAENHLQPRDLPVRGIYPGLGPDRAANILGAIGIHPYRRRWRIVDLGTTFTVTTVERRGEGLQLVESRIVPGVEACLQALRESSHNLPRLTARDLERWLTEARLRGFDTRSSILEGIWESAIGLVHTDDILTGWWSRFLADRATFEEHLGILGALSYFKSLQDIGSRNAESH